MVNKFTQADNKINTDIFEFVNTQNTQQIAECLQDDTSDICRQKQDAAFKSLREQFEKLNSESSLPIGWNTDNIQELTDEIALIKGDKDIIKTACDSGGDDQKCLDEINKLLQNNPKFITILNKEGTLTANLKEANNIVQKYRDLKNKLQIIVKDKTRKINENVLNFKPENQKELLELEALNKLTNCQQNSGKECFDQILQALRDNKSILSDNKSTLKDTLRTIIENDKDFLNKLEAVNNINLKEAKTLKELPMETLKKEYTKIIDRKENDLQKLVQAQAPTLEQVNIVVERQGGWLRVPFGWLITAIAISMGAPFWFDLIGRIMNVRNANKEGNTTKR